MEKKYNNYNELIRDLDNENISDFEELVMPEIPETNINEVIAQANAAIKQGVKKGRPKTEQSKQKQKEHIEKQLEKQRAKEEGILNEITWCKTKIIEYKKELDTLK